MKELIVATRNTGKLEEIRHVLRGKVETILSLADFPDLPEIVEDGNSFEENALKKARSVASEVGKPVIADDSGLSVDSLDGRPGIYSARFAGKGASDEENNAKLICELSGIPIENRGASFHCTIALCFPDGFSRTFEGKLEGIIIDKPKGCNGFGYDPLFFIPDYGKTLSELDPEVKNLISHRARALDKLKRYLLIDNIN
jgi:XTP/dITP diphosphohydrolase